MLRRQPHAQLDAVIEFDDVERFEIAERLHDALVEAESDGEIAQVLRRAHHDRVGAAIVGQRQRGLFRDQPRAISEPAVSPGFAFRWTDRAAHGYSAASAGAMRREWRACAS